MELHCTQPGRCRSLKKILADALYRTVLRIARSSGLPPSVVEETWTLDELLDAVELDELEGAGQAKRLTARVCATIHNGFEELRWLEMAKRLGKEAPPPPQPKDETHWLPRRIVKRKASGTAASGSERDTKPITKAESISRKISNAFADMFGFGEK